MTGTLDDFFGNVLKESQTGGKQLWKTCGLAIRTSERWTGDFGVFDLTSTSTRSRHRSPAVIAHRQAAKANADEHACPRNSRKAKGPVF